MAKLILFNKPYDVLSQFTDSEGRQTLADFLTSAECRGCYAAGRLDRDSEGLLLLTDSGQLQQQITHPRHKLPKTYWVQVEGLPSPEALNALRQGVELKDGLTRPAKVEAINPSVAPRTPPVRYRANIPTSWLQIEITEGRNRQVRRMTAAVGLPTLRLIRVRIGPWHLDGIASGRYRIENIHAPRAGRHHSRAAR